MRLFVAVIILIGSFLESMAQTNETCEREKIQVLACAEKVQKLYLMPGSLDDADYHEYFCRDENEIFIDCEINSGSKNELDVCGAKYISYQWARCSLLRTDCTEKCGTEADLSLPDNSCHDVQVNNCKRNDCCPDETCMKIVDDYESCLLEENNTCGNLTEGCENVPDGLKTKETVVDEARNNNSLNALFVALGICCAIGIGQLMWCYVGRRRRELVHEEIQPSDK